MRNKLKSMRLKPKLKLQGRGLRRRSLRSLRMLAIRFSRVDLPSNLLRWEKVRTVIWIMLLMKIGQSYPLLTRNSLTQEAYTKTPQSEAFNSAANRTCQFRSLQQTCKKLTSISNGTAKVTMIESQTWTKKAPVS